MRLPLPFAPRRCHCRALLDLLGDHRSACATSGVLATRALPLQPAVAGALVYIVLGFGRQDTSRQAARHRRSWAGWFGAVCSILEADVDSEKH